MCAQGTASAFLPKSHLPKLSSSEDQRGEGAGRICCPPRQDDAPQLILQVAGAAARPAGLRSSGPLWLLGIWITYSWLLQPYAEQLCWKIYTWATWKCNSSKALGWPPLPGWAAAPRPKQQHSTHSPASDSVRTQQQQKPAWVCSLFCYNERLHICTQGNTNTGKLSGSQQNHSCTSQNSKWLSHIYLQRSGAKEERGSNNGHICFPKTNKALLTVPKKHVRGSREWRTTRQSSLTWHTSEE